MAVGNRHKPATILLGKLAGGLVTAAAILGFRLVAPKTAKQLDEELSDRYFTPLVQKTQSALGVKEEHYDKPKKHAARRKNTDSYAEKLDDEKSSPLMKS